MTEITVNGMTCTSCATHVKDALEKIPGVNAAVVSYPESRAQVMADTAVSHNQLLAAIAAPPLPMMAICKPAPSSASRIFGSSLKSPTRIEP